MKIRYAKEKDVNEIYKIGKGIPELTFSKKYPFHEKSEIKEFIRKSKENIFLVAEENKKVIGFLYAKIISYHSGGWCMLDNLAVEKKFRGEGIGTNLLNTLYKEMKKRKVCYVQILEEVHHKQTRKFWKNHGFEESHVFVWAEKKI